MSNIDESTFNAIMEDLAPIKENSGADLPVSSCPVCPYGGTGLTMGTPLTLHVVHGHIHPGTKLLEAPTQWVPCVFRWKQDGGKVTDYLLMSHEDLHRMALWIMDWKVVNLRTPTTVDDYDQLREHWQGWFSPADHDDLVHDLDYERFRAIQRARHGALAWWWLQRHGQRWEFEFAPAYLGALPVPSDPPTSPITWLTPP